MPLNRVVALFTPVFAAVAAVGTGLLSKYVGVHLPASDLVALEIAGATSASAAALKWLHGSQLAEKYAHETQEAIADVERYAHDAGVNVPTESELVKVAEEKAAALATQLANAIAGRNAAEHQAGVALTRLAHVDAALGHLRADPNLVSPDVADVQPNSVAQPTTEVAADVGEASPTQIVQAPVAADVPDHVIVQQVV